MLLLALASTGHVPAYGSGVDGCHTPIHHHTTSQAIYLRGSSGLEIHFTSTSQPFDMHAGEMIDFDAVFLEAYDQSTYSLHVGCGGCVPMVDPIVTPRLQLSGYQPAVVEPFTQSLHRSAFPKAARKFNSSELLTCDQGHWSVRLVDHHNRTESGPIVWTAVVGLGERFTLVELLSFPIYILINHRDQNGGGWTFWVILPLCLPLWWFLRAVAFLHFKWRWLNPFDNSMKSEPRAWLYDFAIVGFMAASLEQIVHLIYVQTMAPIGPQFFVGLFVVLFANGIPVTITMFTWQAMSHREWKIANWRWAPIEMLSAFSYLFLFGAGFYVGSVMLFLAALIRLVEDGAGWTAWRAWLTGKQEYVAVEQSAATSKGRALPMRLPSVSALGYQG